MNPEDIIQLLDQLAQRLEGPAKYAFDLAVRQTLIDGVWSAITFVASVVAILIFWTIWFKVLLPRIIAEREYGKTKDYGSQRPDNWQFAGGTTAAFGGIGSAIALTIAVASLKTALDLLLNPEYQTLLRLVDLVHP